MATSNAILGWTDLSFTTQLGWRVEIHTEKEEQISSFRVWYRKKEVMIPLSAYRAIRDPVLSQVQVIELTGSDDFEIEVPAYIFDKNGNARTVRVWTYRLNKNGYVESKDRIEPYNYLRGG